MKCIFCKVDTTHDKSVEHILPESLGNTKHWLSVGVVCDKCNNYFARKIEKPLLESNYFKFNRSSQAICNKRGKVPFIPAIFSSRFLSKNDSFGTNLRMYNDMLFFQDKEDIEKLNNMSKKNTTFKLVMQLPDQYPEPNAMSRLLAKVALEALAYKAINHSLPLDEIVDHDALDPLRNFARYGNVKKWNYHQRSLYDINKVWQDHDTNESYQCLHEFEFLYTEDQELYFVLIIFGIEYAINMGDTEIEGYITWLKEHDNKSPLYVE